MVENVVESQGLKSLEIPENPAQLTADEAREMAAEMERQTENVVLTVVIEAPTANSKGFLKRMKRIMGFQKMFSDVSEFTPEKVDELVRFLTDFVTEPEDRNEAELAVWEFSELEFMKALSSIGGAGEGGTAESDVPPPKNAP